MLHCIWRTSHSSSKAFWLGVFLAIAFAFELGQYAGLVPGFFDTVDALFLVAAVIAAGVLMRFMYQTERRVTE